MGIFNFKWDGLSDLVLIIVLTFLIASVRLFLDKRAEKKARRKN